MPVDLKSPIIQWLGHATVYVQNTNDGFLIDPLGINRCSLVNNYQTILITHAHPDHLNRWTLSRLPKDKTLYVPQGALSIVNDLGFSNIYEVTPGDRISIGASSLSVVDTRHESGRWFKSSSPICVGYVIEHQGITIHHSGDIDMSDFTVFDKIGSTFDIDIALLPIGGMLPVCYYRARHNHLDSGIHIDPDTALDITLRLGATRMIPVHYGTIQLASRTSAPRRLKTVAEQRDLSDRIAILNHGTHYTIP